MTTATTKPFHFKQFSISQTRCAMKVGTDGVLLGAWTSVHPYQHKILDIGTGTGVVALMLAQRSTATTIDAVELDDGAYEEATENFEESPWSDRLFCYHAHIYEFAVEVDEQYDLIVSNPPFYKNNLTTLSHEELRQRSQRDGASQEGRAQARLENSMPFELLVGAVAKLLSPSGTFSVVIPFNREEDFKLLCSKAGLFPTRITRVQGTPTSGIIRSLLEFKFFENEERFRESVNTSINLLVIEHSRHKYTKEYKALVDQFYLKM